MTSKEIEIPDSLKMYRPKQIAQLLGLTVGYIRFLIEKGKIPAFHHVGQWGRRELWIRHRDLKRFIEKDFLCGKVRINKNLR